MSDPDRFDRLPLTAEDDGLSREAVLDWWADRFGIDPGVFGAHAFWERGAGKIWTARADFDIESPVAIEALGMHVLRTRGEHWKPTLEAVQRFGHYANRNVLHLDETDASAFLAGQDVAIDWEGDWGYLVVTHDIAGGPEPIGVGLFTHDTLRSQVPKGRRREF